MPPDPPSARALRACNAYATPTWAIILYPTTQNFVATALLHILVLVSVTKGVARAWGNAQVAVGRAQ